MEKQDSEDMKKGFKNLIKIYLEKLRVDKKEIHNIMLAAFPKELDSDLDGVLKVLPNKTYNNVSIYCTENGFEYKLDDCYVTIPYRVYLIEPDERKIATLNEIQKLMLYCFYTRSCDGYLREKYVKKILDSDFKEWCIPYIIKLCDEYVLEIIEIIYDKLKERDNTDIQSFCQRNKVLISKSYSRMISYWNEFYRGYKFDFRKYIGRKLFRECLGYDRTFER